MKTFIILYGLLALQTCTPTKKNQKADTAPPLEYRDMIVSQGGAEDATDHATREQENNVQAQKEATLNHIQEKIAKAMSDGFANRNTQQLDEIEASLESNTSENEHLKNYWVAYINYYKTIVALQLDRKELGAESNKKGIEILKNNESKNSDDYALLALLKGISYPFASGMKAPAISMSTNKTLKKGMEADDTNFRMHYAQGSIDFYTPKQYGGGKKAEEALQQAIDLPEKNTNNSKLPTWGKEEAYDLIIRFYVREDQKEKAKTYFEKAKKLFPNSHIIEMNESTFKP